MNQIADALIKTIKYFDLFNYPLSKLELYDYLWLNEKTSFKDFSEQLNILLTNSLETDQGFYYLTGRKEIVTVRKQRYLEFKRKTDDAWPYLKLLSRLPFIKAIFLCNNLAYQNATASSDIDLVIITSANKLWTSRFWASGILKMLDKRPRPGQQANTLCLSFWADENNLNFQSLAYPDDIHFIYWLNLFLPVYDPENYTEKLFQANLWSGEYLANRPKQETNAKLIIEHHSSLKRLSQLLFRPDLAENLLKSFQLKIMPDSIKLPAEEKNRDVVIKNGLLKLHLRDNRLEIKNKWQYLCKN